MSTNYPRLPARFSQPLLAVAAVLLANASYATTVQEPPTQVSPSATEQTPVIPPDDSTPCNGGLAYIKDDVKPFLYEAPSHKSRPLAQLQPKQLVCLLEPTIPGQWFKVIQSPARPSLWCQEHSTDPTCNEYGSFPARWRIKPPTQSCQRISIGKFDFYTYGCAGGWIHRRYLKFIAG